MVQAHSYNSEARHGQHGVVTCRPSMSQLVAALENAMRSTDWTSCSRLGRCAVIAIGHVIQIRLMAFDDTPLSFGCCMFASKNFNTGSDRQTNQQTNGALNTFLHSCSIRTIQTLRLGKVLPELYMELNSVTKLYVFRNELLIIKLQFHHGNTFLTAAVHCCTRQKVLTT